MTTLTKVGHTVSNILSNLKDRACNDGRFCDDVAMTLLGFTTVWMMIVAMQPLM